MAFKARRNRRTVSGRKSLLVSHRAGSSGSRWNGAIGPKRPEGAVYEVFPAEVGGTDAAGNGRTLVRLVEVEAVTTTAAQQKRPLTATAATHRGDDARDEMLELLAKKMPEIAARLALAPRGVDRAGLPDVSVAEIVERMMASIPASSALDEKLGPFYTSSSLATWKSVSRQAIYGQHKKGSILGLTTSDGLTVFPAFQFDPHGDPLPGLAGVLSILDGAMDDPWARALWLSTPVPSLGGRSAAQLLRAGDIETVEAAARREMARRL